MPITRNDFKKVIRKIKTTKILSIKVISDGVEHSVKSITLYELNDSIAFNIVSKDSEVITLMISDEDLTNLSIEISQVANNAEMITLSVRPHFTIRDANSGSKCECVFNSSLEIYYYLEGKDETQKKK